MIPPKNLARLVRTTNPYVGIRRTPAGAFRVAPKVDRMGGPVRRQAAEALASYHDDINKARQGAAELLRRYRAWQMLSAKSRLTLLDAKLTRSVRF